MKEDLFPAIPQPFPFSLVMPCAAYRPHLTAAIATMVLFAVKRDGANCVSGWLRRRVLRRISQTISHWGTRNGCRSESSGVGITTVSFCRAQRIDRTLTLSSCILGSKLINRLWLGQCALETITSDRNMASALRIGVLWMFLSLAVIRAEITVETQKLFFVTSEEVALPVSYSGAAINYRVKNYSGDVVLQGEQSDRQLELGLFGPGYYTLELSSGSDELTTNFAVMTPIVADPAWPFGAHTHFAQSHDPALLPAFKAAGIAHIRDEQYWSWLEQQQGVFEFPQHYVNYMGAAKANGIQPLMVLTWSNRFYDYDEGDFTFPYTDSGRAGFVNYTRHVLNRWGSQIKDVELWNEPGADFFQGPATSNRPDYYTQLLKQVYPAVKQLRPDLKVVAGATFPIQHGFFQELFKRDALSYMDAA